MHLCDVPHAPITGKPGQIIIGFHIPCLTLSKYVFNVYYHNAKQQT